MLKFIIVNFIAVMGAAVGQWILGALWYSPVLFGRMARAGAPEGAKAADKRWALSMLLTFGANIATSVVLLHMILLNGVYGVRGGGEVWICSGPGAGGSSDAGHLHL